MEIGNPKRIYRVEPVRDPVPRPHKDPPEPVREPAAPKPVPVR